MFNTILKGVRVRNDRMAKRVNSTGRRKSVKAPTSERLQRDCPHLAFIDPVRYDRVIVLLKKRSAKFARTNRGKPDTRANVLRKRTCWPGQHAICGICGRLMYWGAHGQIDQRTRRPVDGRTPDGPRPVGPTVAPASPLHPAQPA